MGIIVIKNQQFFRAVFLENVTRRFKKCTAMLMITNLNIKIALNLNCFIHPLSFIRRSCISHQSS